MPKTSIEWCDYSWPVLNGCRRKSPGCEHCYAERLAATRLRHTARYKGLAVYGKNGPRWTGKSRLITAELAMPLKLRTPSKIFVCDMGDLFFEENSNEDIAAVFGVMAACPQHTFQVLTKRPERMREWFGWIAESGAEYQDMIGETPPNGSPNPAACMSFLVRSDRRWLEWKQYATACNGSWPLTNVWLGVSCEDQQRADERIPLLLGCPAAVWFVSAEPLLQGIDITPWMPAWRCGDCDALMRGRSAEVDEGEASPCCSKCGSLRVTAIGLGWVIVGGESGPGARPFNARWGFDVIKQCAAASVPAFFKQAGANVLWDGVSIGAEHWPAGTAEPEDIGNGRDFRIWLRNRKGGDLLELPEALRVRQFPEVMA